MRRNEPLREYEFELPGGSFDKDAQGWVCPRLRVRLHEHGRVEAEYWWDINGAVEAFEHDQGRVRAYPPGGGVLIELDDGYRFVFHPEHGCPEYRGPRQRHLP